jgi:membrane protein
VRTRIAQIATLRPVRAWSATRLARVVKSAVSAFGAGHFSQFAAAIAYRVLLSVFPLALLAASVAGLLLQNDERRADVAAELADRFPVLEDAEVDLDAALATSSASLSLLGIVGLLALVWAASGMMASLRIALNEAWGIERGHAYVRGKAIDVLLVVVVNTVVVAVVALSLVKPLFDSPWRSSLAIGVLAATVGWFVALAALYRLVPAARPHGRLALTAAALAAVGLVVLDQGFAVYMTRFGDYDAVYGSLATAVAFLIFVYLAATVVLIGPVVAVALESTRDDDADVSTRAPTGT